MQLSQETQQDVNEVAAPTMALGQYLVSAGLVPPVVIDYVLQKQRVEGRQLGGLLVEMGFATHQDIARCLAQQRGIPYISSDRLSMPEPQAAALFNRNVCLSKCFLPLYRDGEEIVVALGDANPRTLDNFIFQRTGLRPRFLQGDFGRVIQLVRQHYYFSENPIEKLLKAEISRLEADIDRAYSPERLLDHILHLAVRERATDIHLAPTANSRTVLMRIDGVIQPMFALPPALDRLISFIKLKAEMDVAESRLPQDGSFTATALDSLYTIRVSTLIAEFGERMVLRLLPERSDLDKLTDLGFLPDDVKALEKVFSRPHGLILVTGPTGSGKSTTLHAALRMQSVIERNVLTVEDPIEYRVPVACQTEVNRRAGYEFASAMRHFLRHDPDVILVGEIRDAETARAALDAASTGHLVLSTLHVGGIFGVVPRLRLLGVDHETIAENMVAIINQRLVRRICSHCSTEREATPVEREWLGKENCMVRYGKGCPRCRGTGYFKRLPVYEMLVLNSALADAIAMEAPRHELRRLAALAGMQTMAEQARLLVLRGETTIEEIRRAVGTD
ncbi:MAG: GspE/PulE family protein [Rhodoferax sp.]|uniref:GspE/PulE family protein n=1 Tax=Rhodoferax sp. TaxID=50421 RepID=UPI0026283D1A|nr:GspE/PulE family protein [Rhodoferax sp.]MDD5333139.1 GspE/PulE family protein [Rhodoferax sp.]